MSAKSLKSATSKGLGVAPLAGNCAVMWRARTDTNCNMKNLQPLAANERRKMWTMFSSEPSLDAFLRALFNSSLAAPDELEMTTLMSTWQPFITIGTPTEVPTTVAKRTGDSMASSPKASEKVTSSSRSNASTTHLNTESAKGLDDSGRPRWARHKHTKIKPAEDKAPSSNGRLQSFTPSLHARASKGSFGR